MLRCPYMRPAILALLFRGVTLVQVSKDREEQDVIISERGGFQHNNPRLLRVDLSKIPSKRNNDLWERFGFGSWLEDDHADGSHHKLALTSLVEQEWPPTTFAISEDRLPITVPSQNEAAISEALWPVNFCINATIEAPALTTPLPDQKYMVIALLGGGPTVQNGTDSCGNFMLFVTYTNAVGMGVSASGKDWANKDCATDFMSDPPVATTQNLTSGNMYDLSFCYDSAAMRAQIYVNGNLDVAASKEFIFPREGAITFLAGSHEKQQEILEAKLTKFSISAYPTTTTTTIAGITTTTTVTRNPDAPILFHLEDTPRVGIRQKTAEISEAMWPEDFCVSINISVPADDIGFRTIALFGGDARCNAFAIFFATRNVVGMGGTCQTEGNSLPLVTNASIGTTGTHFISFCYARQEGKASIIVDGKEVQADDRQWTYQRSGFVTVFGGSHKVGDLDKNGYNYRELQETNLFSMDMVECTPNQLPPMNSAAATVGAQAAAAAADVSTTTTITSTPLNITDIIKDALGALTTVTTTTVTNEAGEIVAPNMSSASDEAGARGASSASTTVTTTVTVTEQEMVEHVVSIDNSSDILTNHSEHHHSEDRSVSDKTRTKGWSRTVEGDEQPVGGLYENDEDEDVNPRYIPVDS